MLKSNLNYSYYHESLKQRSLIDYFLIPDSCWLASYKVLDIPYNLSDHLVVEISVRCHTTTTVKPLEVSPPFKPCDNFVFRNWSKRISACFMIKLGVILVKLVIV